jgi:hypothetical protein
VFIVEGLAHDIPQLCNFHHGQDFVYYRTCRLQVDVTFPFKVKGFKKLLAPPVDDGKSLPKDTWLDNLIADIFPIQPFGVVSIMLFMVGRT